MTRNRLLILLTALVISLALVGVGSSARNAIPLGTELVSKAQTHSGNDAAVMDGDKSPGFEEPEAGVEGEDPDLPPGAQGRIDEATYLRAREKFVARLRGWDEGQLFAPQGRIKAIEQMQQQEQVKAAKERFLGNLETLVGLTPTVGPVWTELGPKPIPNGQTSPSNPVSGRVSAIEMDPTDPNKVYVGAAQGGVYRSLNGGTTWTPIFDSADTLAIGSLTLDAANGRLWVGTGEANGSADCYAGVGLYRIDNINTTADLVGPINPVRNYVDSNGNPRSTPAFNGRSISKILIVPGDPNSLLVGAVGGVIGIGASAPFGNTVPPLAMRGLYRISNAGGAPGSATATRIAVSTTNTGLGLCLDLPCTVNRSVTDMVYDPADATGNTLLVWLNGINVAGDGGIYRSTNVLSGAPTFTQTFTTTSTSTSNGRGVLVAYKEAANPTVVYVASGEPNVGTICTSTSFGALRRSIDGGVTWSGELPGGGGFCSGQCFYNIGFDAVPVGAGPGDDKLLLGGNVGSTSCSKLQGTSIDGGATTFANTDAGVHADTHVIKFAPSNASVVYRGDDGGIWKSIDGGAPWSSWNTANFRATQFQSIALHPIDRDFSIGGTQDNGTLKLTTGPAWTTSQGGDGGYALIDQNATDLTNVLMYHTFFNSTGSQIGFSRSFNAGTSWPFFGCGGNANGINCADLVNFYAPMALGPGNLNTVYFGSDRLYRSTNAGVLMSVVSQAPLVSGIPISAIAISPQADGYRIVGGDAGALFYTTTGSSTLNVLDPTGGGSAIPDFYVARIAFDPLNKNTAYISLGNYAGGTSPAQSHVWKVSNLSTTPVFTATNGTGGNTLPDVPVNAFAVDPANSNNLYAGTDIGVYNSTDAGLNWSPYGTGLPRVAVFDMAIQAPNRLLRIATHGRGMWETSIVSPGPSTVQFSTAAVPPVTEGAVSVSVRITRSGDLSFPATVNYATADTAGATACGSSAGGSGSSRCDYISTSGTVNFAANESFKDVLIPIVDDAYAEGTESFSINLSVPTGLGLTVGSPASASITVNDNEVVGGPNLIDQSNSFVREQYIDFLNREPDTAGFNFWTGQINSCGSDSACIDLKRINVSAAFFLSIEFQKTGYLVERLYKAAYGDATGTSTTGGMHNLSVPVVRLNEFLPDTQRIGQGVVVNVGNWQQQLEDNTQAFTEEFVQRSRFTTAFPLSMTQDQFVDALNTNARDAGNVKPLSTAERNQLVADLTAGVKTRAQALRAVAEDSDLNNSEQNRAFVLMQYFGYLRRNPNDAPELGLDYGGYEFWLSKLNQFNGNFVTADMVKSFLVSGEYRHRFGAN